MSKKLLNHFQSMHVSVEDRMAAGKALRRNILRSNQGEYNPSPDRADPVSILEAQGETRLATFLDHSFLSKKTKLIVTKESMAPTALISSVVLS